MISLVFQPHLNWDLVALIHSLVFFVGDEIFPLKTWLMRRLPGKLDDNINYRLSRASLTNENIFQILAARWRIFYNPIRARADKVEKYTLTCLALHNYSRITDNATNFLFGFVDLFDSSGKLKQGEWRVLNVDNRGLLPISRVEASCYREDAHVWEIR